LLDKLGDGFSPEELKSPLYVGPEAGQEGWTPANPEIAECRDPLDYIPPDIPRHDGF
jgi:hypothetical protein